MDIKSFKCNLALEIEPIYQDLPPHVRVVLDDSLIYSGYLSEVTTVEYTDHLSPGPHRFSVQLIDKPDTDPHQAIQLNKLQINGIADQKFIWAGVYTPQYPEPWASEQRSQGICLDTELKNTNYMGWNGTWNLNFSSPIFTWIHRTQDLGWIYD